MIDRAAFGRTGHESSRVIFGGAALATMRQEPAPTADELEGDVVAQGMEPLFDGSELEGVGPA